MPAPRLLRFCLIGRAIELTEEVAKLGEVQREGQVRKGLAGKQPVLFREKQVVVETSGLVTSDIQEGLLRYGLQVYLRSTQRGSILTERRRRFKCYFPSPSFLW